MLETANLSVAILSDDFRFWETRQAKHINGCFCKNLYIYIYTQTDILFNRTTICREKFQKKKKYIYIYIWTDTM